MPTETLHSAIQDYDIYAECTLDATAAIAAHDCQAVWTTDFIERAALLSIAEFGALESLLYKAFKADLRLRYWEQAVKEKRTLQSPRADTPASGLPVIVTNGTAMHRQTEQALAAIRQANNPPTLFVRSSQFVGISRDENGCPAIGPVLPPGLRGRFDRCADWVRQSDNGSAACPPPPEVVADALAQSPAEWGVPQLEGLTEVPLLLPGGELLTRPGYDAATHILYCPDEKLRMAAIPEDPQRAEVHAAVDIIGRVLVGFPFATPADRANFLGLCLTPIVRSAISGSTPMALIDAPMAGTGKSLLADVFAIITTGRPAPMSAFPRDDNELAKVILSHLAAGAGLICLDNVDGSLTSPVLAMVLTAQTFSGRELGVSRILTLPIKTTWLATGNNIRPAGDMPRRCYHIRIDAETSNPHRGRHFDISDLRAHVLEHRGELLRALLVMARHWWADGCEQRMEEPLGSFESWHQTVGSILATAGVEGFLSNLESEPDEGVLQWTSFLADLLAEWPMGFFTQQVVDRVRQATQLAPCPFILPDSMASVNRKQEGGLEMVVNRSLTKRLGKRHGDEQLRIAREIDPGRRGYKWHVEKTEKK